MNLRKTLEQVSDLLKKNKIDFALIGGFALAVYMNPRTTFDIDILVNGENKDKISELMKNTGFKIDFKSANILQFSGVEGQVDFVLANKELSKEMIKNSKMSDKLNVRVVSAEDIIGLKIQAYCNDSTRELQDKTDIYALMRECRDLDIQKIKKYADIFGKWSEIEELWKKK